jgi:hypothetical protein
MAFAPQPNAAPDGSANAIDIRYRTTRIRWEYHAESGRYLRFADGRPHADANTGQQVSAANVVIIYVLHRDSDIVESRFEDSVSWSTEIVLRGEGDAVLFRDGQMFTGTWVRPEQDGGQWTRTEQDGDLLGLRTPDGQILYLKPGNTFYQLMPLQEQLDPAEESVAVEP